MLSVPDHDVVEELDTDELAVRGEAASEFEIFRGDGERRRRC